PPLPYTTLFRSSGIGHSSTKVHDVIEATDASTMISCSSMGRPRSRPTGSCGSRALARRSASAPARGVRGCGRALDAELGPLPLGLVLELLVALPGADPAFEEQPVPVQDRKSTRLNSSHVSISYAVFCLKKKKTNRSIKNQSL